ncbi:hypothetical protein EWM64_g6945 [Hericium alpestre]|uniref:Uncharacterized protein n=1 Tax=Hericium alpestre TaxID=135208 RepID=A0A4Y9ZU73_9AGAM|nr:hypothetical protein EWM64_g6945 [Hericium alpestre]
MLHATLFLNEFSHVAIPFTSLHHSYYPAQRARLHPDRATYLKFAPAQYRLGRAYEFAQTLFLFDTLLNMQHSLVSQQGKIEAKMVYSM